MAHYIESIEKLIEALVKLPGVGRRSAERMVAYILNAKVEEVKGLSDALINAKENVRSCKICHNLSDQEVCPICRDLRRNKELVCVVEKPSDVASIEKSGGFEGVYHVLLGAIAPLDGKGPDDLTIAPLLNRIRNESIKEIILATDSDTEGETTAIYLTKLLKPLGVNVSRIGVGLPVGANLEYADSATLAMALKSRRTL
jgi:recombination protein RecR